MFNYKRMAELIHDKGLEQKALAEKVGVSPMMISYIVNGLKEPSLTVLTRIAKALDVPAAELITEE